MTWAVTEHDKKFTRKLFDVFGIEDVELKNYKGETMPHYGGKSEDVNAPILGAKFWKKGIQVTGTVVRAFETQNGICYTLELKTPINVDRTKTYPLGTGIEKLSRVSIGALAGFVMALQSAGVPEEKLLRGDKVQVTCTGMTATDKGNDQVDFDVQVDRNEKSSDF